MNIAGFPFGRSGVHSLAVFAGNPKDIGTPPVIDPTGGDEKKIRQTVDEAECRRADDLAVLA